MNIDDYKRFRYKDLIYYIRTEIITLPEMTSIVKSPIRMHEITILADLIFNPNTFEVIKNRYSGLTTIPDELFPSLFTGVDIETII